MVKMYHFARIRVGDSLPAANVTVVGSEGFQSGDIREVFKGKKAILFGVPGAFTPACTERHLPGYLELFSDICHKGVDVIACLAVNDPFVMAEWARATGAQERLVMISDGNAQFTKAAGIELDASAGQLGLRCLRFAMILDDNIVKHFVIDAKKLAGTSASNILSKL